MSRFDGHYIPKGYTLICPYVAEKPQGKRCEGCKEKECKKERKDKK